MVHYTGDVDRVDTGPTGGYPQPPGWSVYNHCAAGGHFIFQRGDLGMGIGKVISKSVIAK